MIRSYNAVKKQNPDVSKRELYALALSTRPLWKRASPSSYSFVKGKSKLTIEKDDDFKDVVRNAVLLETVARGLDIEAKTQTIMAVVEVVSEVFKNFKE